MAKRLKVSIEKVENKDYYKVFLEGKEGFVKITCEEAIVSTLKRSSALMRVVFNLRDITKRNKYHIHNNFVIDPIY